LVEKAPGQPWPTARQSRAQCKIGFQPVCFGHCASPPVKENSRAHLIRRQDGPDRPTTGWKPMLLYAVARPRLVEKAPGQPWPTARQSRAQCKIGFQPVFFGHCASPPVKENSRLTLIRRQEGPDRPTTGWKPMLLYACAKPRLVRGESTGSALASRSTVHSAM
jgi:hypothetical protein